MKRPTRKDVDIPALRAQLKYAYGLLRYTLDTKPQGREDADMAKSTLKRSIEMLKGVR